MNTSDIKNYIYILNFIVPKILMQLYPCIVNNFLMLERKNSKRDKTLLQFIEKKLCFFKVYF